jgi:uncharacterized alkaline shock family protein YloU
MTTDPATATATTTPPAGASSGELATQTEETGPLFSEHGTTSIADVVVEKIAGVAAREVPGVHKLGGGAARAIGSLRDRIPGQRASIGQGVAVEVGQRQAAIDLILVVEYGVPITKVADAVRENVISSIEEMTGLEVTEVNIAVDDIHLPDDTDDDDDTSSEPRVQ